MSIPPTQEARIKVRTGIPPKAVKSRPNSSNHFGPQGSETLSAFLIARRMRVSNS